ncbi:protein grainyhead-like isoform X12 [Amphibalanus amphitrite]|uniref:protein grainyhead-like isoform X12 n=1 Tax=Amphibalanus amphitrite TaxID=1232801 RepID=UPI001C90779A|nr:protein grainyhead-like isoform X12 [Amphibalanus amphitrite]
MDAFLRTWPFGSTAAAPSPAGAVSTVTSQSRAPADLVSGSELGLLLADREAEDLTARRSPSEQPQQQQVVEQRRGVIVGDGDPGSPRYGAPLAPLHADSPSPKDMSSSTAYTAQYTGLAPAQVFAEPISQYSALPPSPTATYGQATTVRTSAGSYVAAADPYYRDYYSPVGSAAGTTDQYGGSAPASRAAPAFADGQESHAQFVERYIRPGSAVYKLSSQGLAVDLPSPDSGIGAEAATPRDQATSLQQGTGFEYSDVVGQSSLLAEPGLIRGPVSPSTSRSRPWHDFGRQTEVDKIHIPKIFSNFGFRFFMEAPISTSQRREDDRLTYVNKGQFYGITMEYVPDPDKPLRNGTVKSVVMLVFREEKPVEDDTKAWMFWHSRQHSVKQRILDIDTKNSVGLVGGIDEVAHNAVAVYWNPLESSAKISIALQCLSTDFSSQKGVKGLPLHVQIDTYDDYRDPNAAVIQRSYCQVKSFCDKGAERKTRDEERRASKRRMTATGRKKMEEMYHPACERTEFYSMADTLKPAQLFQPSADSEKIGNMELQNYYVQQDGDSHGLYQDVAESPALPLSPDGLQSQYSLPPATAEMAERDENGLFLPSAKRARLTPPLSQRVMLYARQEQEEVYTPLHVAPPTTLGLLNAIQSKYKISTSCAHTLCRKNKKGVTATMDDDMIAHYCNEDTFLLEIRQAEQDGSYHITLIEVGD